jgi:MoaA/NifB/PqqE/SkfB family radical SAM enzyme
MVVKRQWRGYVDKKGRLVLSPEVASRYGLKPGAEVCVDEERDSLSLRPPLTHLRKVYVEATNGCNLDCRTCIRNIWEEPIGQMNNDTFQKIIEGLQVFSPPPIVFFGGFGEPLTHPSIVEMVARAKTLGCSVELITNGTMLTATMSQRLIEAKLDVLWISIDGATPESYADVRLGATLSEVLSNVKTFRDLRMETQLLTPEIGFAFVAMRRNITDLASALRLGYERDVTHFLITNVLPYTAELRDEALYTHALMDIIYQPPLELPHVKLPKMDVNEIMNERLYHALHQNIQTVSIGGAILGEASDRCPFIESGSTAISWEGNLSPCLPLLHTHSYYLDERRRSSRRYVVGNVGEKRLKELWDEPHYIAFREHVQKFSFSHCLFCAGCDFALANEEDCRGNTHPTCGGCLWAQGVIQCP